MSKATFYFFLLLVSWVCRAGAEDERAPVRSLLELRQQNVVIQKWDISCGAAALGTLLNHQHDDAVTEKEIARSLMKRDEYQLNPELVKLKQGFSLLDLKRYVDDRGYLGTGFGKLTLEDIEARAPIILALYIHGYSHFVVFRGRRGNRVLLADPAWGNRTMTLDRFLDVWTELPRIGRVGFTVEDPGADSEAMHHRLIPRDEEFLFLN